MEKKTLITKDQFKEPLYLLHMENTEFVSLLEIQNYEKCDTKFGAWEFTVVCKVKNANGEEFTINGYPKTRNQVIESLKSNILSSDYLSNFYKNAAEKSQIAATKQRALLDQLEKAE